MEGPSIHILSKELQFLVGQSIKKSQGNAKFDKEVLINQTVKDIYPFGKRLIIQLDDYALIVHFLMYGSYKINEKRKQMNPRLELKTNKKQSLDLYNCSIKCINEKDLKSHLPIARDILSPDWNFKNIVKLMKYYPNETIDDVLLNQEIFPGVGNIIKNEALFLSKILPICKVKDISKKKLQDIAEQTRTFALNFLKWRKNYELKKHLLIYRKKTCPTCGNKVVRKLTGKRNRWSFFCPNCQN